jgi:hypothetical protein
VHAFTEMMASLDITFTLTMPVVIVPRRPNLAVPYLIANGCHVQHT